MFAPAQDYFIVGASMNITDELSIIVEHECDHPVANYRKPLDGIFGGHNQISLKYSTE